MSNLRFMATTSTIPSVILLMFLPQMPPIKIWLERQLPALKQRRKCPNRVSLSHQYLWNLVKTVIDTTKLIFKAKSKDSTWMSLSSFIA